MPADQLLATRHDYCRGCQAPGLQRFMRYATADGAENGSRPRAVYRACAYCRTVTLGLADAYDAEGLCRAILRDWLAGTDTAARVPATGPPTSDGNLDPGDALAALQERIWQLYGLWDRTRNPSFTSFASAFLRQRLQAWKANASGEATGRAHGRVIPKAHAPSVSTSLDRLMEAAGDAPSADLGHEHHHADRSGSEALKAAPVETRQLVLLLYCGYSQAEAARRLKITPTRAAGLLAKIRREVDAER